jgi:hypothetical protein
VGIVVDRPWPTRADVEQWLEKEIAKQDCWMKIGTLASGGNQNTGVCISTFGKCNWSCEEWAHVSEPNSGTFFDSIRCLYCRVRFRRSRFILATLTMCS